ncbi:hypothetical protein [Persicirhabdus sediminis]|uniref:Uncharacterized protein n=1 Tax=Persicirhabdus sediminis TaxID=454144 RepID=A0A8J7SH35_9BACT|nr:hypothetical protein [Persicirhabdus sediminis]MBK1789569.1 hypothetical protein [Persicirhabdus sediminis]
MKLENVILLLSGGLSIGIGLWAGARTEIGFGHLAPAGSELTADAGDAGPASKRDLGGSGEKRYSAFRGAGSVDEIEGISPAARMALVQARAYLANCFRSEAWGPDFEMAMRKIFSQCSQGDKELILASLLEANDERAVDDTLIYHLRGVVAEDNPYAVVQLAVAHNRYGLLSFPVLQLWMDESPELARQWFEENKHQMSTQEIKGTQIEQRLLNAHGEDDFAGALASLDWSNYGQWKRGLEMVGHVISNQGDVDSMVNTIAMIEEPQTRTALLKEVMASQYGKSDAEVDEFIDQLVSAGGVEREVLEDAYTLEHIWKAPIKSMNFAIQYIEPGKRQNKVVQEGLKYLAMENESKAQAWIAENGHGFESDVLVASITYGLRVEGNYDRAVDWALMIDDEDKKSTHLNSAYKNWLEANKRSAEKWLSQQDEDIQAFLK